MRDNIANFGGNPEQLILWGGSAGGGLIDNYQYAYVKDPIVKGLISQSAVAYMVNLSSDPGQTSFSYLAEQFSCAGDRTAAQELECMQKVDAGKIEAFLQQHSDSGASPTLVFTPSADGKSAFSKAQYLDMASNPKYPKLVSRCHINTTYAPTHTLLTILKACLGWKQCRRWSMVRDFLPVRTRCSGRGSCHRSRLYVPYI